MSRYLRRGAALILAAALLLTTPALASEALGTELRDRTTTVAQGVTVTNGSLWSATYSDLRTENYITYTPGGDVTPVVATGSTMSSRKTVASMAAGLESQGLRVAAGINGGYFNTTSGVSIGLVITDGVIRSATTDNAWALGFQADGTAFLTKTSLTMNVNLPTGQTIPLWGINKIRQDGGCYLFTDEFGATTKNTVTGVDVVVQPIPEEEYTPEMYMDLQWQNVGSQLAVGRKTPCRVLYIRDSKEDNSIPAGCYVLSINSNSSEYNRNLLSALQPGDQVDLTVAANDQQWNTAVTGVSGLECLVENGSVVSGLAAGASPRTAVGIKADGTVIFYTIDGRQNGYSVGATMTQVAKRLIELGCVTAVNMDGGGSTTLGATLPGSSSFAVTNSPSDGAQRSVATGIFLVTEPQATGTVSSFYLDTAQGTDVVLKGTKAELTLTGVDSAFCPAEYTGSLHDLTWTASAGTVTVVDEPVQTAGAAGGTAEGTQAGEDPAGETTTVQRVYYDAAGASGNVTIQVTDPVTGATGSLELLVVSSLSSLKVYRTGSTSSVTSLTLEPDAVVSLDAVMTYRNLPVIGGDSDVTWTVTGNPGTIDAQGTFTASSTRGSGTITASAGGVTVTIPVTVSRPDPFTDIDGHWAEDYISQLYVLGIAAGYSNGDGTFTYQPGSPITRGEFLTMVCRLLGVNTADYEQVELPFADTADIAGWALPYVKAMYATGVLAGSNDGQGNLYANCANQISRQEAMTILGRIRGEGLSCDLSSFLDQDQVASWARPHVETLVALGIVGGDNGNLKPTASITRAEVAKILLLFSQSMDQTGT